MSDLLTVALAPALDVPETHAVLASLPRSVRAVTGVADVVALDASAAGWPEELRRVLASDARAVLLTNVRAVAAVELPAAPAGVPVVVDSPWALDPTVLAHRERIAQAAASAAVVDLVSVVPAGTRRSADVALDQLALIRVALGPADGYAVRVDRTMVFSQFGTSSTRLSVRSVGEEWRLTFADPANARPTLACRIDEAGEQLRPTLYESARRVAWRQLHAAVTSGARPAYGLPELVADLELLEAAA